jgi:glycosyltransferase involved in cell wall biosynthesis
MFLHPSEEGPDGDREGVPNAMLEAMASGLPVVATSHGGIPEAVENGKSGLLVPEQSPAELAQAMLTLAGDPERYRAMSLAAVQRIRQEFDLARQARLLEAIYSEALQSSAGLQPL